MKIRIITRFNFFLHYGDLTDSTNIIKLIQKIKPDEIYNLAAQSHVAVSFESPEYTANCDALGTLRILEAVRLLNLTEKVKIYQASTSEFMDLFKKLRKKRLLHSILEVHMELLSLCLLDNSKL